MLYSREDDEVAIKKMVVEDEESFLSEICILNTLRHPRCLYLYGYSKDSKGALYRYRVPSKEKSSFLHHRENQEDIKHEIFWCSRTSTGIFNSVNLTGILG